MKTTALFAERARAIDACLDRYIPVDRPVALLQFPHDFNVGNHMMWIAINDYLKQRGISIAYVANGDNFDIHQLKRAVHDGTIIFLGGVTLSRLWPRHAEVKRIVAHACPGNRLVSLPSTMLFVDEDDRREASTIFGDHQDVVLMARDPVSAASAREVFPPAIRIETAHDLTFRLPPQPRLGRPVHDVIWLARHDQEGLEAKEPNDIYVFDWPNYVHGSFRILFPGRVFSRLRNWSAILDPMTNAQIAAWYERFSRWVVTSGNRRLDMGKVLVTDRLHPHILGALRRQHVVLLPDRFGKNRAVYEYSSHAFGTVHWADSPGEALTMAKELAMNA